MDKQTPNYKIVLVALLVTCAVTYWARMTPVRVSFVANLDALPNRIGAWTGHDAPMDSSIRESLNADEVISREYVDTKDERRLGLLIIYRRFGRREFTHRPEMCYPAAGWEITSKGLTNVPYGNKDIPAVKLVAQKGFSSEVIVYWFASGNRTEANFAKQQIWMALDRLRPQKYGWAFIRVNCPIIDTEEDALAQIREFLSAASAPLIKVLTEPTSQKG